LGITVPSALFPEGLIALNYPYQKSETRPAGDNGLNTEDSTRKTMTSDFGLIKKKKPSAECAGLLEEGGFKLFTPRLS
jgi:hypothetical protein